MVQSGIVLATIKFLVYGSDIVTGDGTESDPYLIETENDLRKWSMTDVRERIHIQLVSDIHLSAKPFRPINNLNGILDGNEHSIYGIIGDTGGFHFGGVVNTVSETGEIKNLNFMNCTVFKFLIHRSTGGIVGNNLGSVVNCKVEGRVGGTYQVGGIVGNNERGNIIDCRFEGVISGERRLGGIAGKNNGYIERCSVVGRETGLSSHGRATSIGGVAGANMAGAYIINCYHEGHTEGVEDVGRIVGSNHGSIMNCYASGTIKGLEWVGLIAGVNFGVISGCPSDVQIISASNQR